MMTDPPERQEPDPGVDLKDMPKWAARYAENRLMGIVVAMLLFAIVFSAIGALSILASFAGRHGYYVLAVALLLADLALCAWWVWVVLTMRLRPMLTAAGSWFYRKEGNATAVGMARDRAHDRAVMWVFVAAVFFTVVVASAFDISVRYLQPISALYVVPFAVYVGLAHGRSARPFMLIWPALYAVHAILVLAGVPLLARIPPALSIILPVSVYGLVAVLASHAYNRHALRKLRDVAQLPDREGGWRDEGR